MSLLPLLTAAKSFQGPDLSGGSIFLITVLSAIGIVFLGAACVSVIVRIGKRNEVRKRRLGTGRLGTGDVEDVAGTGTQGDMTWPRSQEEVDALIRDLEAENVIPGQFGFARLVGGDRFEGRRMSREGSWETIPDGEDEESGTMTPPPPYLAVPPPVYIP